MKLISFNTQGRNLEDTKLLDLIPRSKSGAPRDLDLILLQRCTRSFLISLLGASPSPHQEISWDGTSLHSVWTPSMDGQSSSQGLAVVSLRPVENLVAHRIKLDYDRTDPHQCDVYQSFVYKGLRIINFLPPFTPDGVEYDYLDTLLQEDVDLMVGDCHNNYRNSDVHPRTFHRYRVANTMTNYADKRPHENDANTKQLTWLFLRNEPIHRMDNTWELALAQERVAQRPQQAGHSPSLYHIVMNTANGKGRPYSPGINE